MRWNDIDPKVLVPTVAGLTAGIALLLADEKDLGTTVLLAVAGFGGLGYGVPSRAAVHVEEALGPVDDDDTTTLGSRISTGPDATLMPLLPAEEWAAQPYGRRRTDRPRDLPFDQEAPDAG